MARRARLRTCRVGSCLAQPGRPERPPGAGPDERGEDQEPEAEDVAADHQVAPRSSGSSPSSAKATANPRPTQAATTVPLCSLRVTPHTTSRSIRPPSSGRPGSRLNAPTIRLAHASWTTTSSTMAAARQGPAQHPGERSDHDRGQRPHERDDEVAAGALVLAADLAHPAEHVQGDPVHGEAVPLGHDRMCQLVGQDRQAQQHREAQRHRERQTPGEVGEPVGERRQDHHRRSAGCRGTTTTRPPRVPRTAARGHSLDGATGVRRARPCPDARQATCEWGASYGERVSEPTPRLPS